MPKLKNGFSSLLAAIVLVFLSLSSAQNAFAQPDGEKLFKGNCASCHRPTTEPLTGPGLKGVRARWEGREELIYDWIKNPSKVLASGDPYVKKLYSEWEASGIMTAQAVSNEEIDAILAYVEAYVPPVKDTPKDENGGAAVAAEADYTGWYIVIACLLLVVIFSLLGVKKTVTRTLNEKEGKDAPEDVTYLQWALNWMARNKVITALIIVILVVGGLRDTWLKLMDIGVYQGYKPEQPIKFSHKIHAGQNQINCVYCHNTAEKSKHAGIPSANVCMNCHSAISKGSVTGEEEIAKIYEAVGWDKDKRKYTGEEKPIKWVKVHNLPDHVYFNHSQHVAVAGLECQTCHGEIQEMDVVEQHAPLTMGWCIKCHGETEVAMADNGYYDEIHARLTKGELKKYLNGDEKITVKDLGGWECAKCHY